MALDLFRVAGGLQIGDSTQVLEGASAPLLDAPIGSLYTETTTGGLYTKVAAGAGADKWELLAKNSYVVSQVDALTTMITNLGDAFNYVGTLAGGADAGSATDLTALPANGKDAGDYYKVTTAGYFNDGTTTIFANVGDGLVFNLGGGVDKIDSTDSQVAAGSNITVTGSADTGYTVAVSAAFEGRVTTAENSISLLDGRVTTVEGGLSSLTARVTTAESDIDTLQADLAAEVTNRQAADATLQANIDAEATARIAGDATNASAITAEASTRAAADTTLQANIDAEATARIAADTALQNELDATQAGAGLAANGAYTANGSANYIAAATSLADADNKLDAAIKANADAIAAEVTNRQAADATLQANIDAEATARAAADTTLTNNLAAEVTARQAADTALDGRLTTAEGEIDVLQANSLATAAVAATSATDSVAGSVAKWLVWVQDATVTTDATAYEIFAASNGVDVDFNRFGILKLGNGVTGATVNATQSGANIVLTVTTVSSANITIKRVAVA